MADPELLAHREWLGYVQPVGVVVSPAALLAGQAYVNRNAAPVQQHLLEVLDDASRLRELPRLLTHVLGWSDVDVLDAPPETERALPEYGEVLAATYAVREPEPITPDDPWLMLIKVLPDNTDFDAPTAADDRGWEASPQAKFERLLRETQIPIGLLTTPSEIRLVYGPRGETSGHMTFPIAAMAEVAGRPILAALDMLLGVERMFTLPRAQRLPALLLESRRYQNEVSTRLAGQVLASLYEMLRGFQAADDRANGDLLREVVAADPDSIYEGLLTVLLRLVFLLYAEDRDLMPTDEVYTVHYSVGGLFERLRSDAGRHPDTMDLRYGAWAQLLSLFRIVYDGVRFGGLHLPPRHGHLFDPDRFPFLEGRAAAPHSGPLVPLVSDGVIWRVVQNLVVLDGERLSYRGLDVEQIGSVYETMMGFRLEMAQGHSIAIKPTKPHGAPITINLDELLSTPSDKRVQWIFTHTEQKLSDRDAPHLAMADTTEQLVAAIERKIDRAATPNVVRAGSMVLQPNEERRQSGSFYTPRTLTEPIVRTTLRPLLLRLGENPTAEAVLDLKICDPAMGSGAFLVEACRQIAELLVDAWHAHGNTPTLPADCDELLHARRLVAHRCLYGVDRNPIAVDLAKLSLWLATLARDHPFTFVDHALRHGDSLLGLSRMQIESFHWAAGTRNVEVGFESLTIKEHISKATALRRRIREADDAVADDEIRLLWTAAASEVHEVRLVGDLVIDSFFQSDRPTERERIRRQYANAVAAGDYHFTNSPLDSSLHSRGSLTPFHWQLEFPEVFERDNPGFDVFIGNPPFLGASRISEVAGGPTYAQWLKTVVAPSKGQVDLCVFFFRRCFSLLRRTSALGLLATGAISFGDNRVAGLAEIISMGGTIYAATTAVPWPGEASVLVSAIHIACGDFTPEGLTPEVDGRSCQVLNSRLQPTSERADPQPLLQNQGIAHIGSTLRGSGFVLSRVEASQYLTSSESAAVLIPLTGGEEVNAAPSAQTDRYAINFGRMSLGEAEQWPDLLALVRERVLPERMKGRDHGPGNHGRKYWWQYVLRADPLYHAIAGLSRCLVISRVSTHHALRFESSRRVFNDKCFVFALDDYASFAILQSSVHAIWSAEYSSRHGAVINYSVSKTFDTFPFPEAWRANTTLASVGERYFEHRDELMRQNDEGLTATYNRRSSPLTWWSFRGLSRRR